MCIRIHANMQLQNTMAIICDCDGTLAPDTTEFLLNQNNINTKQFWQDHEKMIIEGWDPPIAWMTMILRMIKSGDIKQDTNKKLKDLGKNIPLYRGVTEFIPELKSIVKENTNFADAGVNIKFYIISSGFEDLIKGSKLSAHFDDIFAGNFNEGQDSKISEIKSSITFTEKTKYIFAINKGITGNNLRHNPYAINEPMEDQDRSIPFNYMTYLGDSPGDVPCFSLITKNEGKCIAIAANDSIKGFRLATQRRTTYGPYEPDYRKDSELRKILERIIQDIGNQIIHSKK